MMTDIIALICSLSENEMHNLILFYLLTYSCGTNVFIILCVYIMVIQIKLVVVGPLQFDSFSLLLFQLLVAFVLK